jgi:hypothetical protein
MAHHETLLGPWHSGIHLCLGYKGFMINEFFTSYLLRRADVSIDLATNELHYQRHDAEPWRVHDRWAPAPGT